MEYTSFFCPWPHERPEVSGSIIPIYHVTVLTSSKNLKLHQQKKLKWLQHSLALVEILFWVWDTINILFFFYLMAWAIFNWVCLWWFQSASWICTPFQVCWSAHLFAFQTFLLVLLNLFFNVTHFPLQTYFGSLLRDCVMHDTLYKSILHGLVNHCWIEEWWKIFVPG